MSASDWLQTQIVNNYIKTGSVYLALFTTSVTGGAPGTEVAGGSYARQLVTFGVETDGVVLNTGVLTFSGMPACTVRAGGLYTALSGGNFITGNIFTLPRTVLAGTIYRVDIGDVVVRVR